MPELVAYLGPQHSFCELAAQTHAGFEECRKIAYPTIQAVFAAVHAGEVSQGIVPIENSCEGSVNHTLDLLAYDYDLKIIGELVIPVCHNLLIKQETDKIKITQILSHPQALAQCRKSIQEMYPDAGLREVSSTAEAARLVAQAQGAWGAIASESAAAAYGLQIEKSCIQDMKDNETRFIVISRQENRDRGSCKTSLLLRTLHQPGALYRCLQAFAIRGINLNKIESRPAKTRIGQYLFFVDIDGHIEDDKIIEALQDLQGLAEEIRVLGSYPKYDNGGKADEN